MSIEADAQKDLALNTEDAENVVGGKMNKKQARKKHAAPQAAGHSLPMINVQAPVSPSSDAPATDPSADPSADSGDDC